MERTKSGGDLHLTTGRCTNVYLSIIHEAAEKAANKMVLQDVDTFFDQLISVAVVTISDEEGESRHLCAIWHILVIAVDHAFL